MTRVRRVLLLVTATCLLLCVVAGIVSALRNRHLPTEPASSGSLAPLDKARLAEALHLKEELGGQVWPGWEQVDIPVILWNRDDSFLVGYPSVPSGWEPVGGDTFEGQAYYRQGTDHPQNFTVEVDGRWVASMATKWETDAFLMEVFREFLPPLLDAVFPYWLLVQPSEVQISAVLHESFHAYQARVAPPRLEQAEDAHHYGDLYWQADEAMGDEWREEIELLAQALQATSDQEARALVHRFLRQREQRRRAHGLDGDLLAYERWLEWEEGLAKYVELAIWREAYTAQKYEPLASVAQDPDFGSYATFPRRWSQEIGQMKRQATREGETRFYYTGMAQAMLLDRLLPGWKPRVFSEDTWLETLLWDFESSSNWWGDSRSLPATPCCGLLGPGSSGPACGSLPPT
jgi:hypothetical protein